MAVALNDPDILIPRQPFRPIERHAVRTVAENKKPIVLFSSHQMNYGEFCRHRHFCGGSIVCSGAIRDIKRSYDRLKIVLLSPEADKVEQYIKTGAADIVTAAERAHDTVTVTLVSADKKMELLRRLSEKNLNLDRFDVYEPSLNDIFVECTEGSI